MLPKSVNLDLCDGCGLCLLQCNRDKIIRKEKKVIVNEFSDDCIACGHCYAICPHQAIEIEGKKLEKAVFKPLESEDLFAFLRSRRSHRKYKDMKVPHDLIKELLEYGRFAPTGSNAEPVRYILIDDADKIKQFSTKVVKVYKTIYKILRIKPIKFLMGLFDKRLKGDKLLNALKSMIKRQESGEDPIFYNAPLVIVCYVDKYEASTAYDDCAYAMYNMVLGAESLGLSSCLNGFSTNAIKINKSLRKFLGLKKSEIAYTCSGFGYPLYQYHSFAQRKEAVFRYL